MTLAAVLCVGAAVSADSLRQADVGTPMKTLLTGLNRIDRGVAGRCGGIEVSRTAFVMPSRPQDEDNASFIGLSVKDRLAIVIAYDEQDLGTPVTVYADLDGVGNVTNVWAVEKAPHPCAILSQMR